MALALVTYAWFPIPPDPAGLADRVLVSKGQHTLTLFRNGQAIRVYHVALGRNPDGTKTREGDHKTPEGNYALDSKNARRRFHLSMHVSYPNEQDRERAAKLHVAPGGNIMVHGIKNGFGWLGRLHRLVDWTDGCVALTNPEMEQFARLVPEGTPIQLKP
jgi:murein L,D-transpeptidase YafK